MREGSSNKTGRRGHCKGNDLNGEERTIIKNWPRGSHQNKKSNVGNSKCLHLKGRFEVRPPTSWEGKGDPDTLKTSFKTNRQPWL